MAFRKRKRKNKNIIIRNNNNVIDNNNNVITNNDKIVENIVDQDKEEEDDDDDLIFKKLQSKRRKQSTAKKKGLFASSNRTITSKLNQQQRQNNNNKIKPEGNNNNNNNVNNKKPKKRKKKEKKLIELNKKQVEKEKAENGELFSNDKEFIPISLEESLKILINSIEYRKEKYLKTQRKLVEIEKEEENLMQDIESSKDLDNTLSKKNNFFINCKTMILNAVQSYKDIVDKIEQMYLVQDGIWKDQFHTSIINNNNNNNVINNDVSSMANGSASTLLPLPPPAKLYSSRKNFLLQAASTIDMLFIKPFDNIKNIKTFFNEWKKQYPFEYTQTYAEISMVDFCIPLIKRDMLEFDPMLFSFDDAATTTATMYQVENRSWFSEFSFDSKALANILNKCLLPRVEYHLNLINESNLHLKTLSDGNVAKYILQMKSYINVIEKYCNVLGSGKNKMDSNCKEKIMLFKSRF